jgi:hypothetical protein
MTTMNESTATSSPEEIITEATSGGLPAEESWKTSQLQSKGGEASSSPESTEDSCCRGGYSGDCSASDQSSDDTCTSGSAKKLSVYRLDWSTKRRQLSATNDNDLDSEHRDYEESERSLRSDVDRDSSDKRHASGSTNHRKGKRHESEHHSHDRHRTPRQDDDFLDIEHLLQSTSLPYNAQWNMPPGPLPQWNGVRLTDFMDPRFDLKQDHLFFHPARQVAADIVQQAAASIAGGGTAQTQQQSLEQYLHLLAVRDER